MDVKPRLLDQIRQKIRFKHYSIRIEQAYVDWIRRYILYHQKRHPQDMGKPEKDVSTTMIYTHVLNRGGRGVASPLDQL